MKQLWPILVMALAAGCATPPKGASVVDDPNDLPTLQAQLADRLSQLKIGMTLEEFRKILPDAYVGGQSGTTTAYELARNSKYVTKGDMFRQNLVVGWGSPKATARHEVLWFYFYQDRLVQWGKPEAWPKQPDLIIENRSR